jgi:hypothetical protein
MSDQTTYQRLAERFPTEAHKRVNKGGRDQTYIPWTDKVERLNDVLASDWSFRIIREGMTDTEAWVLAEIETTIDGVRSVRQQYGCEAITRGREAKAVTDLFKIAASDALSKAATLFGCGLYLSIQEERAEVEAAMQEAIRAAAAEKESPGDRVTTPGNAPQGNSGPRPMPSSGGGQSTGEALGLEDALTCEQCGESLTETRFKDGTNWGPSQLAVFGRRKHSRILCMTHYREANQVKRRAEEVAQNVAF